MARGRPLLKLDKMSCVVVLLEKALGVLDLVQVAWSCVNLTKTITIGRVFWPFMQAIFMPAQNRRFSAPAENIAFRVAVLRRFLVVFR